MQNRRKCYIFHYETIQCLENGKGQTDLQGHFKDDKSEKILATRTMILHKHVLLTHSDSKGD